METFKTVKGYKYFSCTTEYEKVSQYINLTQTGYEKVLEAINLIRKYFSYKNINNNSIYWVESSLKKAQTLDNGNYILYGEDADRISCFLYEHFYNSEFQKFTIDIKESDLYNGLVPLIRDLTISRYY